MVDAFKYFKSSNLRVEDIDADAPVDVTIGDFKITSYDDDECEHIDLYFKGTKKPLGLNNTNLRQVVGLHGRDTEDWIGQQITLIVREVGTKARSVRQSRIDDKDPAKLPSHAHAKQTMTTTAIRHREPGSAGTMTTAMVQKRPQQLEPSPQ